MHREAKYRAKKSSTVIYDIQIIEHAETIIEDD